MGMRAGSTGSAHAYVRETQKQYSRRQERREGIGKPGSSDPESRRKGFKREESARPGTSIHMRMYTCVCLCVLKANQEAQRRGTRLKLFSSESSRAE